MARGKVSGVEIQKKVLERLCYAADINLGRLSTEIGFNPSYFSLFFSRQGEVASVPKATAVAACQVLGCTMDVLTEPPAEPAKPAEVPPELIDVIREGFRMLHADLQAILKAVRPEIEEIRIGEEASK